MAKHSIRQFDLSICFMFIKWWVIRDLNSSNAKILIFPSFIDLYTYFYHTSYHTNTIESALKLPVKNKLDELPKYMTRVKRKGNMAYKYQRHVPKEMQTILDRERWDLSLGSNFTTAMAKRERYASEHDALIARLDTYDKREKLWHRSFENERASILTEVLETGQKKLDAGEVVNDPMSWRDIETQMKKAADLPSEEEELQTLVLLSAVLFDDRSYVDQIEDMSPVFKVALQIRSAKAPDKEDGITFAMFMAAKSALGNRIETLVGSSRQSDKFRLSTLCDEYLTLRGVSNQTRRSYLTKTKMLTDHLGDLPLDQYTPDTLRAYREHLMVKMTPTSVSQYFAPIKAIMRWAMKEDLVPGFDVLPTDKVAMPRITSSVEDTRWQRFDNDEIKSVWGLLQEGWGSKSGFDPKRCEAFKMAFRVLLYTAARPVEVFRLTPASVTPDLIHITQTKTGISRTLPLSRHIADFYDFMQTKGWGLKGDSDKAPRSAAGTMSDTFTKIIRAGGLSNDRQVLYSCKDTLVDRLQRDQRSEDIIRGITGHVSGQGHLRNYKTRLNDTPEGLAILRDALDGVTYW